jgi:hypothetical protein
VMTLTEVGDLVVGNSQRQLFLQMVCRADIHPYSLEKSISYLGEEDNAAKSVRCDALILDGIRKLSVDLGAECVA